MTLARRDGGRRFSLAATGPVAHHPWAGAFTRDWAADERLIFPPGGIAGYHRRLTRV